jgi:hypothetical protein
MVEEYSLLFVNIALKVNVFDRWWWNLNPTNGYSVSEVYYWLTHQISVEPMVDQRLIWNKWVLSKTFLFVWRLFDNLLPTKDNLFLRSVINADPDDMLGKYGKP